MFNMIFSIAKTSHFTGLYNRALAPPQRARANNILMKKQWTTPHFTVAEPCMAQLDSTAFMQGTLIVCNI